MSTEDIALKRKNYILLLYIGLLIGINLFMVGLVKFGQTAGIDGQLLNNDEAKRSAIKTILVGFTILGFIIGSLLSFIPYKQLPYRKKYIFFSLMSILIMHVTMLILGIRNLILF